jgi:DNA mismatch repair protein MutL
MTIAILPARLANQIAAGEVVERPASVIKELIENSIDAGSTVIHITVDKGGIKKIKITDNGSGIAKDELGLALSRHATSKIQNLSDLEAINSLGFRGEALASISSVARLTLTSKPKEQDTAWQAMAEGRDMAVTINPAAHPDGTTIEVLDLFFNTPARRKFLRTEKTEFNHIDEVVRRIALARFDVSFTLTHNGKVIRQYRAAETHAQTAKRVAMVCGPKFIEHAVEVDCQHDNMRLSGWVAKPSFVRSQNDLCYSYVNGRMMRDKLINHAIRQAYDALLPTDTYPAFVLFLEVDYREVDVNVHPSKHEVRFHQSRYVHDFIYSVCRKALVSVTENEELFARAGLSLADNAADNLPSQEQSYASHNATSPIDQLVSVTADKNNYQRPDYVTPLQPVNDVNKNSATLYENKSAQAFNQHSYTRHNVSPQAVDNYKKLVTPFNDERLSHAEVIVHSTPSTLEVAHRNIKDEALDERQSSSLVPESFFLDFIAPGYALFKQGKELRLLSLFKLAERIDTQVVADRWQQNVENTSEQIKTGLISQPLLLPVMLTLSEQQNHFVQQHQSKIEQAGITLVIKEKNKVQIRQFPALLRDKDVTISFTTMIDYLIDAFSQPIEESEQQNQYYQAIARAMTVKEYKQEQGEALIQQARELFSGRLTVVLGLNSVPVDLTSHIKQLI